MMPSSKLLMALPLFLAALLLLPAPTHATCNVGYKSRCDSVNFTATSDVVFHVNRTETNKNYETYNVTIVYHWEDGVNTTVGPTSYEIDEPYGFSVKHQYEDEGFYKVGYTLTFEDDAAAGCSGKTYSTIKIMSLSRTPFACDMDAETPTPTVSPTVSAGPTVSSVPTVAPVAEASGSGRTVKGGVLVQRILLLVAGLAAAVASL